MAERGLKIQVATVILWGRAVGAVAWDNDRGFGIKGAADILAQVVDSVARWSEVADEAGVPAELKKQISRTHRLQLSH